MFGTRRYRGMNEAETRVQHTEDWAIAFLSSVNPIILEQEKRRSGLEGEILGDVISNVGLNCQGMSIYLDRGSSKLVNFVPDKFR